MSKLDELGGIEGIRKKAADLPVWTEAQALWVGALIERVEELERELRDASDMAEARGRRIAEAEIANQLKNYDAPGFLGDVSDPIYMQALRIENMGFEAAHELRSCGHSRGDYRDPKYGAPDYRGNEACIACEQLQSARELAEEVRDADVAANSDMSKADLRPSIYEWGCIARMAREFLQLLGGK